MSILVSRGPGQHRATIRTGRLCTVALQEDTVLLQNGVVTLSVEGASLDQGKDCSEAITLFHHGPAAPVGDAALTIALLGDGTIRALHRCNGDTFELRGGRVHAGITKTVRYEWGPNGSRLFVGGDLADQSLAVLTLAKAPEARVALQLDLEGDLLTTDPASASVAQGYAPTDMSM